MNTRRYVLVRKVACGREVVFQGLVVPLWDWSSACATALQCTGKFMQSALTPLFLHPTLVSLYREYTFRPAPGSTFDLPLSMGITLSPAEGVPVTVHKRN